MKSPPPELARRLLDVSDRVLRTDPPPRLEDIAGLVGASRAMIAGLADYLGRHPGICAGLLGALGGTGRMADVLQANDTRIAGPLRDLLAEGRTAGTVTVDDIPDAANAILGALLLAVLGRAMSGADPTDRRFHTRVTEQLLHGVLAGEDR